MVEVGNIRGNNEVVTERRGRVTDMHLPHGNVRILYEDHRTPINVADVDRATKGIFLEHVYPPRNTREFKQLEDQEGKSTYKDVLSLARREGTPLYFHDVDLTESHMRDLSKAVAIAKLVGYPLATAYFAKGESLKKKLILAAPFVYDSLTTHWAGLAVNAIKDEDRAARISRAIVKTHPYFKPIMEGLRNAIWATKLNWALENIDDNLTTPVGANHIGLEESLRRDAQNKPLRLLQATHRHWAAIGRLSSFYSITRFTPDPETGVFEQTGVFEVPKLKELAGVR